MLQTCQFSKTSLSIPSQSKGSRKVSIHTTEYLTKKLKERLSDCCLEYLVGDSVTSRSPGFRYMEISWKGERTVPSVDYENYASMDFAI